VVASGKKGASKRGVTKGNSGRKCIRSPHPVLKGKCDGNAIESRGINQPYSTQRERRRKKEKAISLHIIINSSQRGEERDFGQGKKCRASPTEKNVGDNRRKENGGIGAITTRFRKYFINS